MSLYSLEEKYADATPVQNPIMHAYNKKYKMGCLGEGGKIYLKRGKMFDKIFDKDEKPYYIVPIGWRCPEGFHYKNMCWTTDSEMLLLRHYRKFGLAQKRLISKFDDIIKKQDYIFELSKATDSLVDIPEQCKKDFIPRPHQKVAIKFGKLTDGCFLCADQMRTGKSFSALLYVLSEKWEKCLIVAPSKVVQIWGNMIESICDIKYKILGTNDTLESGFNIISYDALHTIRNLDVDIAICDESHFFLEGNARRSQAVKRIQADKRIALSGTMILNKSSDILAVLEWVNPDIAEDIKILLDTLYDKDAFTQANEVSLELRRRCLLLRETHQVGTTSEPIINFIEIDANVTNPKSLQEVGRAKVDYAIEYLRSFKEKILVIFYYRETGKMIKARLGNDALLIDGMSSKEDVENALKSFKDNEVQYLVASNVIGEGIDISHCNNILIVEESSHSMRIDQIRARCSNIYKEQNVIIDILVAKNTQDDRLYDILNTKYDLQDGFKN